MKGEFKPAEWNQFEVYLVRTNNGLEIYNNSVNNQLRTKPTLLRFFDFIREQENLMSIDV